MIDLNPTISTIKYGQLNILIKRQKLLEWIENKIPLYSVYENC